ncbi:MAG: PKD domain-containing protein [Planctomycetota bacterium]
MRKFSSGVFLILFGSGAMLVGQRAFSEEPSAENRDVTVSTTDNGFPGNNPYVDNWSTSPLAINQNLQFSVDPKDTTNTTATFTYLWSFGDGATSTSQSPKHYYAYPGSYFVTVATTDSVTHTQLVSKRTLTITDAIKNASIKAWFNYNKPTKDIVKLYGVLRLPGNGASAHSTWNFDIGSPGLQFGVTLDGKGNGTITSNANVISGISVGPNKCNGTFKVWLKKVPQGTAFQDAAFQVIFKNGTFLPAWGTYFITNRNAERETVRLTTKINVFNIANGTVTSNANTSSLLYQSTLQPQFNSVQNKTGVLR